MSDERYASVWDAIENTPAEAENLKLRSALMMALEEHIKRQGWSQSEAARALRRGLQPRISESGNRAARSICLGWIRW